MKKFIAILALASMTACATADNITPIIDHEPNYDVAKYLKDLDQCRDYANERDPATEAALGAIGAALTTIAIGAAMGDARLGRDVAGAAAVAGAVGGAGNSALSVNDILLKCLKGRGYNVLGSKAGG
jgi:hypothetical protein